MVQIKNTVVRARVRVRVRVWIKLYKGVENEWNSM